MGHDNFLRMRMRVNDNDITHGIVPSVNLPIEYSGKILFKNFKR